MTVEYRVVWQRGRGAPTSNDPEDNGSPPVRRTKIYQSRAAAARFLAVLTGDWAALGKDADGFACCEGMSQQCGCSGLTNEQQFEADRERYGECEWARLQTRKVETWEEAVDS